MTPFFRRIRQKLANDNQFLKYSRYAIGEILLVVVGILIALQINNWNENRKLNLKSFDYLKRLQVDLDDVSKDVNWALKQTDRKYNQALVTLEALEARELPPNKVEQFERHLKEYFQFEITIQKTTAYNEMLSSGDLGLIENEWLRTAFSDLSDNREFIMEVNQSNHSAYKNNMELIEKHIRYHIQNKDTDSTKLKVTYNFDAMVNDDIFINQISNQVYTWFDILGMYKRYQLEVNSVKDSVQIEIKKYNKIL